MTRISYEKIILEADRIITRMALSSNSDIAAYYWKEYTQYITACGWSNEELDNESLKRLEASWDNNVVRRQINIWN